MSERLSSSESEEEKKQKKSKPKKSKSKPEKSRSKPKKKIIKELSLPNDNNILSSPSPSKNKNILLSYIKYNNLNKITRNSLRNGRRIFNNKTELASYDQNDPEFNKNFIEFRQLFFEDLLLTEDLKDDSENDVIHKTRAETALFSTFIYDGEFIEPFINQFKMPSIIIRHQDNQKFNAMDEYGNYIKFIFPKISQTLRWGKFHSKLIILKFPSFLRIIVPSANLTDGDWYYWGQIIWFQDFFLISENKKEKNEKKSNDFREYLKQFMKTFMPHTYEGKRFWTDLKINFDNYDFSDAAVDLIASANGRFLENEKNLFGVGRLNYLMNAKYLNLNKNNNLLIQCSSFGVSKQKNFFLNLYKGFNLKEENSNNNIDIYYPTENYILTCEKGIELSSCLFFSKDAYKLYEDKLHDVVLKDKFKDRKTVFHSKIFITGNKNKINNNFILNNDSIIYIGSHNFSASAWGNFEKNETQISMANYELGIIFDLNMLNFMEKLDIYNNLLFNFDVPKYSEEDKPFFTDDIS